MGIISYRIAHGFHYMGNLLAFLWLYNGVVGGLPRERIAN